MPLATSHPSMSHSPAHYDNRFTISTTPYPEHGPASSHVQQPPAAHLYQQRRSLSPVAASPASHQSSESGRFPKRARAGGTRRSDVGTTSPQSTSPPSFSLSSSAEQGSINHSLDRGTKRYSGRYDTYSGQRSPRPDRNMPEYHTTVYAYTPERGGVERSTDHAVPVLLWLACFDPFYSLFSALYTIFTTLALLAFTPFRLCRSSSSFEASAIRFLAPLLRLHLRLMYAASAHDAHELEFKAWRLVAVQLAAPVVSMGVAMAEWIAAPFWIFAIVLGNPDGTERWDDGRATVLAIRNWWEQCLLKAAVR